MPPLIIDAIIDDAERPALDAACVQLRECLRAASGTEPAIEVRHHQTITAIGEGSDATLVLVSLLRDAMSEEPLASIESRWRADLEALTQRTPPVFLCTVFRHVAKARGLPLSSPAQKLLHRIRRLDLLATDWSHDIGVNVIDIDRALAHLGGRLLATGHRLAGATAARVAGHAIAYAILTGGLDDWTSAEALERAKKHQGNLKDIGSLLRRRLGLASGRKEGDGSTGVVTVHVGGPRV